MTRMGSNSKGEARSLDNLPVSQQGSLISLSPARCPFGNPKGKQQQVEQSPFPCYIAAENTLCKKD